MKKSIYISVTVLLAFGLSGCGMATKTAAPLDISEIQHKEVTNTLNGSEIKSLLNGKTIVGETVHSVKFNKYIEQTFSENGDYMSAEFNKHTGHKKNVKKGTWFIEENQVCIRRHGVDCETISDEQGGYVTKKYGKVWSTFTIKTASTKSSH